MDQQAMVTLGNLVKEKNILNDFEKHFASAKMNA
eukprot:CAMPEP_0170559764 /NCGR_PEP_ID=MMETSP0211-20121228/44847_1 /TAXON_ID=311385 /ORGANISM="Pseudokeronopsis sp., Strain OXSARD2" /LENGTH=33 /DNA_ID= /DNA_START= /DNA_END= /DNA_ORIENTATION=